MDFTPSELLVLKLAGDSLESSHQNRVTIVQLAASCEQEGLSNAEVRDHLATFALHSLIAFPALPDGAAQSSFALTAAGFEQYIRVYRLDLSDLCDQMLEYLRTHPRLLHAERISGGEVADHFGISVVFTNLMLELLSNRRLVTIMKLDAAGQILLITGLSTAEHANSALTSEANAGSFQH